MLSLVLAARPEVICLDEPTPAGLLTKERLAGVISIFPRPVTPSSSQLRRRTAADVASRVIILADGEIVADGSTQTSSPLLMFAPQVAKILAPQPWLTVEQVRQTLAQDSA